MYIVTRADLAPAQQAIQAAHAAVELALGFPQHVRAAPTLVILAADGQQALYDLLSLLNRNRVTPLTSFFEPDLGHALTAVAFIDAPRIAKRFPLALQEMT